jgi:hypothetical protein
LEGVVSTVTEVQPWDLPVAAEDVADSRSAARWSVREGGWKQLLPALPDDVIALLATPVVVSAQSIRDAARPADPAQSLPSSLRLPPPGERQPQFLAPAPPRRPARRRAARH